MFLFQWRKSRSLLLVAVMILALPRSRSPMTQAPYPLNWSQIGSLVLPADGEQFLLPVCTTPERLRLMIRALIYYQTRLPEPSVDHLIDVLQALNYVANPAESPCMVEFPEQSGCVSYSMDSPFIQYAPMDPNAQTGYAPPPYSAPPWRVATGPTQLIPGLKSGDVYTDWLTLVQSLNDNAWEVLQNLTEMPRFTFYVVGSGEVELDFIAFPQGGYAYIVVDDNFAGGDWVDLSTITAQDLDTVQELIASFLSLPIDGGLIQEVYHEIEVTGNGEHKVTVYMMPKLNMPEGVADLVNIVQFGGGVRSIELCGFDSIGDPPMPEIRMNGCNLEWRPNANASWSVLGDVCGPQGPAGADGLDGAQGPAGPAGPQGPAGPAGSDAPTPVYTVNENVSGGTQVLIDTDADGFNDVSFVVPDGEQGPAGPQGPAGDCDCGGGDIPAPISLTDAEKCRVAFYMAEKLSIAAKELAYDVIVNQNSTSEGFWALIKGYWDNGALFNPSLGLLNYMQSELNDYYAVEADLNSSANRQALAELLYCNVNLLSEQNAITPIANATFYTELETAGLVSQTVATMSSSEWNAAVAFAIADNGGVDCSGFCVDMLWCHEWDFTQDEQGWQVWSTDNRPYGVYVQGVGWRCSLVPGTSIYLERLNMGAADSIRTVGYEIEYTSANGDATKSNYGVWIMNGTTPKQVPSALPLPVAQTGTLTVSGTLDPLGNNGYRVNMLSFGTTQDAITLTRIKVYYTSGQPTDGSPCV